MDGSLVYGWLVVLSLRRGRMLVRKWIMRNGDIGMLCMKCQCDDLGNAGG